MKKNSFLTFCFAMIPGAGEMYIGLMKKGAVVMLLASILFGLWGFLNLGIFAIFLPVLWFYSFFDTFNLRAMDEEQRYHAALAFDRSLQSFIGQDWNHFFSRRHNLVGAGCIVFGVYILFHNFITPYLYQIDLPWLRTLINRFPTLVVVALVIWLGVHLISTGTRPSRLPEEDYVEYGGNKHE